MEACMRTIPLSNFHAALSENARTTFAARVRAERDAAARARLQAAGIIDDDFTNDHLDQGLNFVVMQLLPRQALARAKREL